MSNPPMPSLYGQIIETFRANFKLILIFTLISTSAGVFLWQSVNEMMANLQFALENPNKTDADLPFQPSILSIIISFTVGIYIYYQLAIVSIMYHQQPPHQPRTAPWLTDKGFHQHIWRYMWHHFLIIMLYIAVMVSVSLIIAIGAGQQNPFIGLIGSLLFFISFIALAPLTATKLAAVIDPNGDTSFKAAFRRGKDIFWKYLGVMVLIMISMFIFFIILEGVISVLGVFFSGTVISDHGQITMPENMGMIGTVILFIFMFISGIIGSFFNVAFAVIASHYYIWSEYYLAHENKGV